MATAQKFNAFVNWLAVGNVNLGSDTLKLMLTNTAPVAGNSIYSDISATEVANGNGYTTGGAAATVSSTGQTSGTYTLKLNSPTWTASGAVGPFRYAVLYDSTPASNKTLILFWDYASSVTLASGDTFTATFDGSLGVLTLA